MQTEKKARPTVVDRTVQQLEIEVEEVTGIKDKTQRRKSKEEQINTKEKTQMNQEEEKKDQLKSVLTIDDQFKKQDEKMNTFWENHRKLNEQLKQMQAETPTDKNIEEQTEKPS